MLAVMLARGARAQRARTWSRGCNTALNLRGDRAGYHRNRFRGSQLARRPRQRGSRRSLGGTNALEKRSRANRSRQERKSRHGHRALPRALAPMPRSSRHLQAKKASRTGGGFPHRGVRPCELGRSAWQVARTRPPLGHPRPSRSASAKEGRGVGAGAGDAVGDDRPTGGGAGHASGVDRASGHAG